MLVYADVGIFSIVGFSKLRDRGCPYLTHSPQTLLEVFNNLVRLSVPSTDHMWGPRRRMFTCLSPVPLGLLLTLDAYGPEAFLDKVRLLPWFSSFIFRFQYRYGCHRFRYPHTAIMCQVSIAGSDVPFVLVISVPCVIMSSLLLYSSSPDVLPSYHGGWTLLISSSISPCSSSACVLRSVVTLSIWRAHTVCPVQAFLVWLPS